MNKLIISIMLGAACSFGQLAIAGSTFAGGEKLMNLSQRHSGYALNSKDWIDFLTCWKNKVPKKEWDDEAFLLRFSDTNRSNSFDTKTIKYRLSKSVLDFYTAYESMGGLYRDPNISGGLGILSPTQIQALATYLPDYLKILNEEGVRRESSDVQYFKYGTEQNDAHTRTSHQNNAIVIGQYGYSDYELIVLYPDSLTKDGEMETAIFAHASENRTPSFAEMMRQLSFVFTRRPPEMPIQPQERLKGTCADKLPLNDVWWK